MTPETDHTGRQRRSGASRELGRQGEDAAASWYLAAGYRLLARNWRCRFGEIDLVASRPGTIVFCEVKTRSTEAYGTPAEAVVWSKRRRLRRLAGQWLADQRSGDRGSPSPAPAGYAAEIRFDIAEVRRADGHLEVSVIENAF